MYKSDIGIFLSERYQLPVIMENDINATAIGFGRCYAKEFPEENPEDTNMAFLHFEEHCVSAGFISAGVSSGAAAIMPESWAFCP